MDPDWTGSEFPDLRGPTSRKCGIELPHGSITYVCDPDRALNRTEIIEINARLHNLSTGTPCHCQRRSQCMANDGAGNSYYLGFVVSVAIVKNLQMTIHDPTNQQLTRKAAAFSRTLQAHWSLGDCGNSAIIFVWQQYKKVHIFTGRLTSSYLTEGEKRVILSQVQQSLANNHWAKALMLILDKVREELAGQPEGQIDIGTLSLLLAVSVAVALVTIITCCVCAFRCCGNLRPLSTNGSHNHLPPCLLKKPQMAPKPDLNSFYSPTGVTMV